MRIDTEDFRRHYGMLSDSALFALNRADLIEAARSVYDEEVARRKAARQDADRIAVQKAHQQAIAAEPPDELKEPDAAFDEDYLEPEAGPPPEWLEEAACACTFSVDSSPDLRRVQAVLRAAGIPSYITTNQVEPASVGRVRSEHCVMVPGALNLHAISVLDRDIFNADQESDWRSHLSGLTDDEMGMLSPDIFCAGLLDRAARLKNAYDEELARRHLPPRN